MMYCFGYERERGHALQRADGRHARWRDEVPFSPERLDGGEFLPGARLAFGRWVHDRETQSACWLTHVDGWTLLAFWDRSGDSRNGSNTTFLCAGTHDHATMVAMARLSFPKVVERIDRVKPLYEAP